MIKRALVRMWKNAWRKKSGDVRILKNTLRIKCVEVMRAFCRDFSSDNTTLYIRRILSGNKCTWNSQISSTAVNAICVCLVSRMVWEYDRVERSLVVRCIFNDPIFSNSTTICLRQQNLYLTTAFSMHSK